MHNAPHLKTPPAGSRSFVGDLIGFLAAVVMMLSPFALFAIALWEAW